MNISTTTPFAVFFSLATLLLFPSFARASEVDWSVIPTAKVSTKNSDVSLLIRNSNIEAGYNTVEIYHTLDNSSSVEVYKVYETPVASKGIFVLRPSSFEIKLTGLLKDPGEYTVIIGSGRNFESHSVSVWPDCDEISHAEIIQYDKEDELLHASVNVSGIAAGELGVRYLVRYRYLFDSGVPSGWSKELFTSGGTDFHLYIEEQGNQVEFEVRRLCDGYLSSFSIASDWVKAGVIEVNKLHSDCDINFELSIEELGETYATLRYTGSTLSEDEKVWILYGARNIENIEDLKQSGTEVLLSAQDRFEIIGLRPGQEYQLFYGMATNVVNGEFENLCLSTNQLTFNTEDKGNDILAEPPPQERTSCGEPFDTLSISNSFPDPCYEFEVGEQVRLGGVYFATFREVSSPQITQAQVPVIDTTYDPKDGTYTYDTTGYVTVTLDCFYESAVVEIQLPFQGKTLLVDLNDFSVNEFGAVVGGTAIPQRQTVNQLPQVVTPISLGSDFCNPPPQTDLPELYPGQAYGFDTTGVYSVEPPFPGYRNGDLWDTTGTYDPNGFDANGIHYATGSPWGPGPDSCSREGFNPSGEPCDPTLTPPYAWLHDTTAASTTAGIVFSNELKGTLENDLDSWLSNLSNKMQDSISSIERRCNTLRGAMNLMLSDSLPSINRESLFGANDKYFRNGMYSNWANRPEEIVLQFSRFSNIKLLETQHQLLYVCDENLGVRMKYDSLFNAYTQSPHKDTLELYILEQAQTLEQSQVVYVNSHPDTLLAWVQAQIYSFLKPKLINLGFVSNDIKFHMPSGLKSKKPFFPSIDDVYSEFDRFAAIASAKFEGRSELDDEDLLELARFEFAQGFSTVAGVDRVHFLAQMERERRTSFLNATDDELRLPLFLDKEIGSIRYTIILDNVSFDLTTLEATVDAYFIFYPPQDPTKMLALQVQGLSFNPSGIVGQGRMTLQTPFEFKMFDPVKLTLNPGDTYVDWDCDGFAGMNLDVGLDICRKYLTPTDADGVELTDPEAMVHSDFDIYVQSWNSILVDDLSITPFRPTNVEQAHFVLSGMSVDFSDFGNPSNLVFPANYETPHINSTSATVSNQWRGVFIETVSATLPREEFGSANSTEPLVISGHNLIFDQVGVSGLFTATGVVPLSSGDVGGWAASIDEISVGLLANQLTEGRIEGKLHIPLFGGEQGTDIRPEDCVTYRASACANGFMMEATAPQNGIEANVMLSSVKLDGNTSVLLLKQPGQAPLIQATLSGELSIGGGELPVSIEDISFQGLRISNQRPFVEISAGQAWELPDIGIDFKGFGLNIENARILPQEEGLDLKFTTGLNLFSASEDGPGAASISGSFRTKGVFKEDGNGRQRMYFEEFKLDTFCIDVKINVAEINGKLIFFDETGDPNSKWGKGFYGGVRLAIETKKGFALTGAASAVFGRHNEGYKYFMVDAAAEFSPGIPIVPGLVANGFGGGISRRMRKVSPSQYAGLVPPALGYWPLTVGETLSGAQFVPDDEISFGLAIAAGFTTESSESVLNMTARVEAEFLSGGGISRIGLGGSAQIMEAPNKDLPIETDPNAVPPGAAMVKAIADISLDFENEVFSGSLVSYVNMQNTIKGAGANDRAGLIDVYFGSDNWHVKFGTPSDPLGVKFVVPGLDAGGLTVESYFVAGTAIEPPRGLPQNVLDLVGEVKQSSVFSDGLGQGIAFGTRFDAGFDTGDKIKPFKVRADIGAGFDVGLRYLGDEATCANRSSSGVGINGWYARGQLFAYFDGEIGLKAKIGSKEKEFNIASLAAAFMLQAELPNPLWAQGAVAVRYRLLGGILKGDMDLQFEVGEQCVLVGNQSATANLSIISSILPVNGGTVEDQAEVVTVNFLIPLNEEFTLEDFNENDDTKYLAFVDSLGMQDQNGRQILGEFELDEARQELVFTPYSMLPSNDTLTFRIKASIKEDGVVVETERRTITFATGDFPPVIPTSNISGSYPYDGQRNYYRRQLGYSGGMNIQLHRGQPDIVESPPAGYELILELEARASGVRSKDVYKTLSYDHSLDIIHVPVKTSRLVRGRGYKATLLYRDKTRLATSSASSSGASSPTISASIIEDGVEANGPTATSFSGATSNPATSQGFYESVRLEASGGLSSISPGEGAISTPTPGSNTLPDIQLYEMYFRVSEFNTFLDEVNSKFDSIEVVVSRKSFEDDSGGKVYFVNSASLELPSDYNPDSREMGLVGEPLFTVGLSTSSLSSGMSDYLNLASTFSAYDGRRFESVSTAPDCPYYTVGGGIYMDGSEKNELVLGSGDDFSEMDWRNYSNGATQSSIKFELGEISKPSKGVSRVFEGVHSVYNKIDGIDDEEDAHICMRCFNYGPEGEGCVGDPSGAQDVKDELRQSLLQGLPAWVKQLAAEDLPSVPPSFNGDLILHYNIPVDGTPSSSVRVPVDFSAQ